MKIHNIALVLIILLLQVVFSSAQEGQKPAKPVTLDHLFSEQNPVIPKRGVHMDLKGLPPTAERFVELLKVFAAARYNVVLVEWEDSFPWTIDKRFRSPAAYTPDDIRRFQKVASDLDLELIPLVTCLGHMQTPLSVPGYEKLREVPDNSGCLNPLAPGSRELIQGMVDDVLKLMPDVKHFHLGGDEAWQLGENPQSKAFIEKHGKGALYLHHVEPILDSLNARNIRPILWHDMMIDWDSKALNSLAGKSDLMTWGYAGYPENMGKHCNTEIIKRFTEQGIVLWGATAYKGAEGYNVDLPDIAGRAANAQAWARVARQFKYKGVVATAWSRYAVDTVQCVPIDAALDSLVNVGVILHDGNAPAGGIEACVNALEELGEKKRFEACKKAMTRVTNVRKRSWELVQQVREQIVLARIDPRRTSARNRAEGLKKLQYLYWTVTNLERIADEVRQSFDGLIPNVFIEEYLATRVSPLREELDDLTAKADKLK
ncbi:MAG: family 20 glycosylhydrolase [Phycisphaerae bacterium]|nr:family 20 glycosylhydrolase [Phycisphaerae bacterium]